MILEPLLRDGRLEPPITERILSGSIDFDDAKINR
jgi:hypothetical protein